MQKYTRDIRYADYSDGKLRYCGYADNYESIVEAIEFDACAKQWKFILEEKRL